MPVQKFSLVTLIAIIMLGAQGCAVTSVTNPKATAKAKANFDTYSDFAPDGMNEFSPSELHRHQRKVTSMCRALESDAQSALNADMEAIAVIKYERVARLFEVKIDLMKEERRRLSERSARLELGHEIDVLGLRLDEIKIMLKLLQVSAAG